MHISVYVVLHMHEELGYEICGICCTKNQAERACIAHKPIPDWTVRWVEYPLHGFPMLQVIVGVVLALSLVLLRDAL